MVVSNIIGTFVMLSFWITWVFTERDIHHIWKDSDIGVGEVMYIQHRGDLH